LNKAIHGFFNIAIRKRGFRIAPIFIGFTTIKNGGTPLYRKQPVEKPGF
jgi:hypothetical protein